LALRAFLSRAMAFGRVHFLLVPATTDLKLAPGLPLA
jgi:hypothetical protein